MASAAHLYLKLPFYAQPLAPTPPPPLPCKVVLIGRVDIYLSNNQQTILANTSWTNTSEGKPDLVEDQNQQYKITLKIDGKADRTVKGW